MDEEIGQSRAAMANASVWISAGVGGEGGRVWPSSDDSNGGEVFDPYPGWGVIGPVHSERKVRDWALVLQSSEIRHIIRFTGAGWVLLVQQSEHAAAVKTIDRYEAENRDWPPRSVRDRARYPSSPVAPLLFAALAAFFLVTGPSSSGSVWFRQGVSIAERVMTTEPWRAVTALTLHTDATHLLGNVISGSIFASAVQRRFGAGGAALAIVASGTIGNLANAFWRYSTGQIHHSIGASTAVFGAIGLLAATQMVANRVREPGQKVSLLQIAAPLVGGLALLGALGASPQSDLWAHFFGLGAGLLIGLAAAFGLQKKTGLTRPWVQVVLAVVAVGIVAASWQVALLGWKL